MATREHPERRAEPASQAAPQLGRVVKRTLIGVFATVVLAAPAQAEARQDGVFCAPADGSGLRYKIKPRNCTLASGPYGYQQAPIRRIRWRSWGGASAYGRGTLRGNMGFRAPVRFKLYRPRHVEFGFYVYTRAQGTTFAPNRRYRWRKKIVP